MEFTGEYLLDTVETLICYLIFKKIKSLKQYFLQ